MPPAPGLSRAVAIATVLLVTSAGSLAGCTNDDPAPSAHKTGSPSATSGELGGKPESLPLEPFGDPLTAQWRTAADGAGAARSRVDPLVTGRDDDQRAA